ncbi:centrosomal protein of 104 kDa [Syngnathus typhle]|uniref:centrosomal protein of 104 kDa n=1 Tax=Syngnathus typhle TaxID=161592 RepID=UPI002A6ADE87|nr:centrosomal protein of 104 kDa [Syngnathus typhle]XP_061129094.1 centrosomal protein of 104 kDa [Syngnathus typhle]XP_061129095.1 centrosomal protein of 104 kDa [Syngnathus typhle]
MTRKIAFIVLSSSSHEDNFSAQHLIVHAPTVSGWRSSRLCSYPQHITLQLVERSRVRKLQLLAHHYLIPAKVEFHIGDSPLDPCTSMFIGQLHKLGYVSLSDNEKTGFRARELKSVHVDAVGTYLRITFHRNHANRHNRYDQVALVAINVLGDPLDGGASYTIPRGEQLIEHYLNGTQLEAALDATLAGKYDSTSPLDDLAFDMYQDPEVACIIRQLDQKKQDMVHQERFEQAKYLKQAIADLQKAGEHLARFDVERQCAIEKEEYDLAKKKKDEMDAYRRSVYQQLEVHNLFDHMAIVSHQTQAMITSASESCPAKEIPSPLCSSAIPSLPTKSIDTKRKEKALSNTPQSRLSDSDTLVPKWSNSPCSSSEIQIINFIGVPFDERHLPAPQRKDQPVEAIQSPAMVHSVPLDTQRSLLSPVVGEEPEPLSEKAQREAGHAIEVYGESLVARAYSKSWSNREDALLAVHKKLLEVPSTTPKEELRSMIRAAVFLVKRALSEKVSSVFQASLKLLLFMLSQLIPGLGRVEVTHCLENTWPTLLARTGDLTNYLRNAATATIQEIAALKDVRVLHFAHVELVKPFKSNFPSRLAQSRAELLENLLVELGTENSGFTVANVMMFCMAALEHGASAVREVAVRIILSMYKQHSSAVLSYFPSPNAARKNFLYRTLFDGFAKIDGKLVETQDGQNEKEEIHSLQEQLAALKDMTEGDGKSTKGQMAKKEVPKVKRVSQKTGKQTVLKLSQNKTTPTEEVQQSVIYLDNLCIFCGKTDDSFTEDGLDLHYWKHCPMLRRCDECKQVVEISSFTEHLLSECDSRSKFSQCLRCSEAVATEDLTRHIQGTTCKPPVSGKRSSHCPLCHSNFSPGEEAWKAHLTASEGCKQNSRRAAVSQRTQPAQGKAVASTKVPNTWSVGSRGGARPLGRGSRIPSLAPLARGHTPGKR